MVREDFGSRSVDVSPVQRKTKTKYSPQDIQMKGLQKSLENLSGGSPTTHLRNEYFSRTTSTPLCRKDLADDSGLTDSLGELNLSDTKSPECSRKKPGTFSPDFMPKKTCFRRQGPLPKFSLDEPEFTRSPKTSPTLTRKFETSQLSNRSTDSAFHDGSRISTELYQFDVDDDSLANLSDLQLSVDTFCESLNESLGVKNVSLLIGRRMGVEKLNIFDELNNVNLSHVIAKILSYLSPSDINSACQVCPKWKEVCKRDVNARRRRKEYIRKTHSNKENSFIRNKSRKVKPLVTLQTTTKERKKSNKNDRKLATSQEFWEAQQRLKPYEKMTKCPKCNGPAAKNGVYERGRCCRSSCAHNFCTRCELAFHFAKPCSNNTQKGSKPTAKAFSKKSRRLLDRL